MGKKKNKEKKPKSMIIRYKILYTTLIILLYLIGREIPLYGIDLAAYIDKSINAEDMLLQTVGGDTYRYSLLALGISPYIVSSILMQVYTAMKNNIAKQKIAPHTITKLTVCFTMILAIIQAASHVKELEYRVMGSELLLAQVISGFQMVVGVVIILWLSERNQKYGIGGRTALIYVNITDGIISTMVGQEIRELKIPLLISAVLILVVIVMENAEFRIPLQRISIHNIYADKNYLAIKLNPVGMMPIMFSSAFFTLPKLLLRGAVFLFPQNEYVLWCNENMTLTRPLGMVVYLLLIYLLTIGFSMIYVNPGDLTEQFLKSGDSLLNIRAGEETRRYLSRILRKLGFLSASVMSLCVGIPLFLQYSGDLESTLMMLPSSMMFLTGMWSRLYQEYEALRSFESYEPFI